MAKTFTEQVNAPRLSWTADSQGMHANIPYDFVRWSNNLATYCNPHTHFFHGATDNANAQLEMSVPGAAREVFMCQLPVAVPTWASKMLWTAGMYAIVGSMSSIATYITAYPYTGAGADDAGANQGAFQTTNMVHGYKVRSVSASASAVNYAFADDSSTGIATPTDQSSVRNYGLNHKLSTYIVITATTSASDSTVSLRDFTCWFQP